MMKVRVLVSFFSLIVVACGDAAPAPTVTGPTIRAELAHEFRDAKAPAREAQFSPTGALVATSSSAGDVMLRKVPGWQVVRRLKHPDGATSVAFSSDGAWLLTGGYDGTAHLWDVSTGQLLRVFKGAAGTIWTVDISPDRKLVAAAGEDKIVHVWNAADGRVVREFTGHDLNIWRLDFSPAGEVLASSSFDSTIRIWNVASGKARVLAGHKQAIPGLDFNSKGTLLLSGSDDSTLKIWRAADGAIVRTFENENHAYQVAFSPDDQWIASAGRARGAIGTFWHQLTGAGADATPTRLIRASDGKVLQLLPHGDDVVSVGFSPDGQWLVTSGEDSVIRVWRLRSA